MRNEKIITKEAQKNSLTQSDLSFYSCFYVLFALTCVYGSLLMLFGGLFMLSILKGTYEITQNLPKELGKTKIS
jgi:hypothetical protein